MIFFSSERWEDVEIAILLMHLRCVQNAAHLDLRMADRNVTHLSRLRTHPSADTNRPTCGDASKKWCNADAVSPPTSPTTATSMLRRCLLGKSFKSTKSRPTHKYLRSLPQPRAFK